MDIKEELPLYIPAGVFAKMCFIPPIVKEKNKFNAKYIYIYCMVSLATQMCARPLFLKKKKIIN